MPSPQLLQRAAVITLLYTASTIHTALTIVTAGATPLQGFIMVNTYAVLHLFGTCALVIRFCCDYLQNSLGIPHVVSWLLVASCFSSRVWEGLGIVVSAPFKVVLHIFLKLHDYRKESDEKIAALQKRLEDIKTGRTLPQTLITIENHMAKIENVSSKVKRWESRFQDLQVDNHTLKVRYQRTLDELERLHQTSGATQRHKLEQSHKTEVRHLRATIDDQVKEIQRLKANVDLWKTQHQQHDCALSSEGGQKLQAEIDTLNDEIHLLNADKHSLTSEIGDLKTSIHKLEPQVLKLKSMTEVIHRMAENSDMHLRFAVTFFASALLYHGANLAEFGIDPSLYETYVAWAKSLMGGGDPSITPVTGFRLKGTVLPLSGSFVSGDRVFGASMKLLDQVFAAMQVPLMQPQSQSQALALSLPPRTPPRTPPQNALVVPETANTGGGCRGFASFGDFLTASKAAAGAKHASVGSSVVASPEIRLTLPTPTLPSSSGNEVCLTNSSHMISNNISALGASNDIGEADEEVQNPDDFFKLGSEKTASPQSNQKSTATFESSASNNASSTNGSPFNTLAGPSQNCTQSPATSNLLQTNPNAFAFLLKPAAPGNTSAPDNTSSPSALTGSGIQRDANPTLAIHNNAPFGGAYVNNAPSNNAAVDISAPYDSCYSTNASSFSSFGSSQTSNTQPFGSSFSNAPSFSSSQRSNGFVGATQNDDAAIRARLMGNAPPFTLPPPSDSEFGGFTSHRNGTAPFDLSSSNDSAFNTRGGFGGQNNSMPISGMMNGASAVVPHGAYNSGPTLFSFVTNNTSGFGGLSESDELGASGLFGNIDGSGISHSSGFGQSSNSGQSNNFGQASSFGQSPSGFSTSSPNPPGFKHTSTSGLPSTSGIPGTWGSSGSAGVPRNPGASFTMFREPPSATGAGSQDEDGLDCDAELALSGERNKKKPFR